MFKFEFKKVFSDGREVQIDHFYIVYWYKNRKFHRDNDLPAVIYSSGPKEWWKNGNFIKRETK